MPFAESLSRLQDASALLGMHGSGLMNVVFMRSGSTLVEVLPKAFASHPLTFGVDKYDFLASELGIDHVQIHAREESFSCVAASSRSTELLRDCDVRLSWSEVETALARGGDRYSPWVPPRVAQLGTPPRTGARGAADGAAAEHTSWGRTVVPGSGSRQQSSKLAAAWACTTWPAGPEKGDDAARCLHGNTKADGFVYAHNRYRGTQAATCLGACTCCRRPASATLSLTT